ncbi:EndoU domain-containing protein [Erwinia rhapontici]|uniref:EndoU domain-containing protein n=1 Tax=Erwinia TaxID=551 RepID=UPI003BA291E0
MWSYFPRTPRKTTFPNNWSAEKIINEVGDIATSPNTKWFAQTGTGGVYTSKEQVTILMTLNLPPHLWNWLKSRLAKVHKLHISGWIISLTGK